MTPTETLRQCRATLSLIDRADCKDDAVWQKVVDTQAEVDRVLRDDKPSEAEQLQAVLDDTKRREKMLIAEVDSLAARYFHEGVPPHPFGCEWFIAVLDNGEKVVLRELPEEYSYDYKTADEAYYKAFRIKKWMQFPNSAYITHVGSVLRDGGPSAPTDISRQLRAQAKQPFGPEGFALLVKAADEIERYYGGMMAWKATAEAKDRVLVAAQPVGAVLSMGELMEKIDALPGYLNKNDCDWDDAYKELCTYVSSAIPVAASAAPSGDALRAFQQECESATFALKPAPSGEVGHDAVAEAIFNVIKPSNMIDKDWRSGAILGFENGFRDQVNEAAKAAIAAITATKE